MRIQFLEAMESTYLLFGSLITHSIAFFALLRGENMTTNQILESASNNPYARPALSSLLCALCALETPSCFPLVSAEGICCLHASLGVPEGPS